MDPEGLEPAPFPTKKYKPVFPDDYSSVADESGDFYALGDDGNYEKVEMSSCELPIGPGGLGKLKDITRIATGKNIKKLKNLIDKWGGKGRDWRKMKGTDAQGREWHWYQKRGDGTRYGIKPPGKPDPF